MLQARQCKALLLLLWHSAKAEDLNLRFRQAWLQSSMQVCTTLLWDLQLQAVYDMVPKPCSTILWQLQLRAVWGMLSTTLAG